MFLSCFRFGAGSLPRVSMLFNGRVPLGTVVKTGIRSYSQTPIRNTLVANAERVNSQENKLVIGKWLLGCSGMVFGAVLLGGITRLTDSGLSMVDWHLVKERPPLSHDEWIAEFAKYKKFPDKHHDIDLSHFKLIWYMEYIHRMWGRATGAVFILPAAYFWYRGYFNRAMKKRVPIFGLLLGFQGLLGWYMVKSGLEEKKDDNYVPRVSPSRLAFHLGTAFLLYSMFLWSSFVHLSPSQNMVSTSQLRKFRRFAQGMKGLTFVTVISGAFVAGLGAGLTYNTFPKMADKWIPDDILGFEPKWINFTQNPTTVQFKHRILGTSTFVGVVALWLYSRKLALSSKARFITNGVLVVGLTQVVLGISTLLLQVPIALAALHQATALTLFSFTLWLSHELKVVRKIPK